MLRNGIAAMALIAWCAACAGPGSAPVLPTTLQSTVGGGAAAEGRGIAGSSATGADNEWIFNPGTLPPGHKGSNNCKFNFPAASLPDLDAHPDAGCWERETGHEQGQWNLYREQFSELHFDRLTQPPPNGCSGGPGDLEGIRICFRDDSGNLPVFDPSSPLISPCGTTVGPNGCARCLLAVTCHLP